MSRTAIETPDYGSFFQEVKSARRRVLVVDYDGTLAPFHADRRRARPYPRIPELLKCIGETCATRLIVVSGRSAQEVPPLIGIYPAPEIWGTHGIERINGEARHNTVHVSHEALQILAKAEVELERAGLAEHVEIKLAGVALHWRGLTALQVLDLRTRAYRILEPLASQSDLVLVEFEEGVELRLSSANKSDAIRNLISDVESTMPIAYLGDDFSDEDAFEVLNGRGLTVLVSGTYRPTAAQVWLRPPDELIQFFMNWIRACSGGRNTAEQR